MVPIRSALASSLALVLCAATPFTTVHAANWRDPYGNVDHRWDAGNDTGDSQIPTLNDQQLNQNYKGPWYIGRPPPPGVRPPPSPPPGYVFVPGRPPGYYATAPRYAPSPYPPYGPPPYPGYPPPGY